MLERMWSKGSTHPLLVVMQPCATTLEITVAVSQKIANLPTLASRNITLGHIPKRCPIILQEHLFNYVQNRIICNSQNVKNLDAPQWKSG